MNDWEVVLATDWRRDRRRWVFSKDLNSVCLDGLKPPAIYIYIYCWRHGACCCILRFARELRVVGFIDSEV